MASAPQDSILHRRRKLAKLLTDGVLDTRVLDTIIPGGTPIPDEDQYWDYKEHLAQPPPQGSPSSRRSDYDIRISHLIKDIVSFYNVNGGYLIIGVRDSDRSPVGWAGDLDCGDISKRMAGLTRVSIDIKFRLLKHHGVNYGLIYIPERPASQDPVQFVKSAPEDSQGRRAFSANDIYLRARDECRRATSSEDYSALFRRDRPIAAATSSGVTYLENNLPARDPNLLDFVGREDQLNALWRWFTERYTAVKLLSGPGGVGKTSIAWQFCDAVSQFPPEGIQKIVWLTAKKRTFAALLGEWVEITHTHFSNLDSLLRSILGELGSPDEEVASYENRTDLIEAVISAVSTWPCFLVVDDVDSLPTEEQFDVFRSISTIFDRVIATGNSKARALLTARLTLGAAPGQLMTVGGMPLRDFEDYVRSTAAAVGAPFASGANWNNDVRRLHEASSGSPLFAASILRLISLGEPLSAAIRQYKGAEGEEVRRFAFERELDRLTDSQLRLLYAAINLGDSTFHELLEVIQTNRTMLRDDIGSLRDYHLMAIDASVDDLARGTSRVSVPAVIVSMTDLIRKKISDPKRIETACARARREAKRHDTAPGRWIKQVIAHWYDDDYDRAVDAAQTGTKNCPGSGDLWCVLGRSYLKRNRRGDLKSADSAFRKAKELGCLRRELIHLWIEVKKELGDWIGLIELLRSSEVDRLSGQGLLAIGEAYQALGDEQYRAGSWLQAADLYWRGAEEISVAFSEERAHGYVYPLMDKKYELAVAYVDSIFRSVHTNDNKIAVWEAVRKTVDIEVFNRGQIALGARSLSEWWDAVQLRPRIDDKTISRLLSEGRSVQRIARRLAQKGGSWLLLSEKLSADAARLLRSGGLS